MYRLIVRALISVGNLLGCSRRTPTPGLGVVDRIDVKLSNPVRLPAQRTDKTPSFFIMMERASSEGLSFRTQESVQPGDVLEIEALLPGLGNLRLVGQITSVTAGLGYSGSLELTSSPQILEKWRSYVGQVRLGRRASQGVPGSALR